MPVYRTKNFKPRRQFRGRAIPKKDALIHQHFYGFQPSATFNKNGMIQTDGQVGVKTLSSEEINQKFNDMYNAVSEEMNRVQNEERLARKEEYQKHRSIEIASEIRNRKSAENNLTKEKSDYENGQRLIEKKEMMKQKKEDEWVDNHRHEFKKLTGMTPEEYNKVETNSSVSHEAPGMSDTEFLPTKKMQTVRGKSRKE